MMKEKNTLEDLINHWMFDTNAGEEALKKSYDKFIKGMGWSSMEDQISEQLDYYGLVNEHLIDYLKNEAEAIYTPLEEMVVNNQFLKGLSNHFKDHLATEIDDKLFSQIEDSEFEIKNLKSKTK